MNKKEKSLIAKIKSSGRLSGNHFFWPKCFHDVECVCEPRYWPTPLQVVTYLSTSDR